MKFYKDNKQAMDFLGYLTFVILFSMAVNANSHGEEFQVCALPAPPWCEAHPSSFRYSRQASNFPAHRDFSHPPSAADPHSALSVAMTNL